MQKPYMKHFKNQTFLTYFPTRSPRLCQSRTDSHKILQNAHKILQNTLSQIENEYGTYMANQGDCDYSYLSQLRDLARRQLGKEAVLFSTDNAESKQLK